ncbi:MAG: hypothetical protein RI562_00110 [Salibacter sp.]|uniref:hypothetical protein n=1 Tax=Salibacter sp. TaxID=2010995 RepID=UPI00286FD8E8|nr:hypothetical protein [Salibacter sp.]MDR9397436.1 hypothetical protein [Salibacter sp.]
MKKLLLSLIFFTALNSFAQDETYRVNAGESDDKASASSELGDLYVVPFKDALFKCHFSQELMNVNGLKFEELSDTLKFGLVKAVSKTFGDSVSSIHFQNPRKAVLVKNNELAFNSMKYEYVGVPKVEEEKSKLDKFKSKFKKKEEPKREGTYIENGQLRTNRSKGDKYMNAVFQRDDFLFLLREKHQTDYLVSINQLDFVIPMDASQLDIQHNRYNRNLQAHYSVYKTDGTWLHGGKAAIKVPASDNSVLTINETYMPELAKIIFSQFQAATER